MSLLYYRYTLTHEILYCHHGKHLHRKAKAPPVLCGLCKGPVCLPRSELQHRTPEDNSPKAHLAFIMTALGCGQILAVTDQ